MSIHFLLPLTILVVKIFEEVARRTGTPSILGAILAGVILGPIGFNAAPGLFLEQHGNTSTFNELAQIGLCVLLFRIGTESRLDLLQKVWRQAVTVAFTGMLLPLGLGWLVAVLFGYSSMTGFFIGATLTATSIGVTVPVLRELKGGGSKEGLVITSAAILDDVLGLILLSTIMAVVQPAGQSGSGIITILSGILFILAGFTLGPILVRLGLRFLRWLNCTHFILVFAFGYLLILAQIAYDVGLDMIIGAYAAGVAFSAVEEREQIETGLKSITDLFAPLFFVLIGASVRLPEVTLENSQSLTELFLFCSLLPVAFIGKFFSGSLLREKTIDRWVVGCGMLPRGEVGLIFAQIGLLAGLITESFFSFLVILLVVTTYIGPLLLKYFWKRKSREYC